jgi:predicted nucleotidyltransferase
MMTKKIKRILKELKSGLEQMYGKQFKSAYLFGSYARGDSDAYSDIDVLIVLADFKQYGSEIKRTSDLVGKLSLDYGETLSVIFSREKEWKQDNLPLLMNIRAERIAI